jgi:tRNA splicing endonuclease
MTAESPASLIYCGQAKGLLEALGGVIHELIKLHEQQFTAVLEGDPDSGRFDDLIHMANDRKHEAKYAYLQHLSDHGCSRYDIATG